MELKEISPIEKVGYEKLKAATGYRIQKLSLMPLLSKFGVY
jgi:hypothetical protein